MGPTADTFSFFVSIFLSFVLLQLRANEYAIFHKLISHGFVDSIFQDSSENFKCAPVSANISPSDYLDLSYQKSMDDEKIGKYTFS